MLSFSSFFADTAVPAFYPVRQIFPDDGLRDIPAVVVRELEASGIADRLPEGEIAIAVGSRGIANIAAVVRTAVSWFKAKGAAPFIVPCMGSHGGATAEGQTRVLAELGITAADMGCAIRSSMDVEILGTLENGLPVCMDKHAWKAAGVFAVNRIKPHTSFSGPHESGLVKMLTIGLGNQKGADAAHRLGNEAFGVIMPAMARMILARKPGILGGLALVENERDETCRIEAVLAENLEQRDADLLLLAKSRMPSLPVNSLDLLIVDCLGKNISGVGMDTNVTGRHGSMAKTGGPAVSRLVVLGMTPETKGNAYGMGMADIIPRHMADTADYAVMYANAVTSSNLWYVRTPMVLETEEAVVRCGIKTCSAPAAAMRALRIRDTLSLGEMLASPALAQDLRGHERCEVAESPRIFAFSTGGELDKSIWRSVFNNSSTPAKERS